MSESLESLDDGIKENTNDANDTTDDYEVPSKRARSHANVVAAHYNHIEEKGVQERFNSPIFYLRNFNNWVKSVLIQEYTDRIREKDYGKVIRVLDICCGKGGDLGKWQKARAEHVVFADIADVSIDQCKSRYDDLKRRIGRLFTAEFIAADCTRDVLRHKYHDPSIKFDLASCQFGLHYSFESLAQARRMLANISECLKPGGYFIGTVPDAYEIVSRCQKSQDGAFGNRIFNIKLLFDPANGYPLFGAKYDFHLEGVVDCPEFLVNFELFVKLATEYGLELTYKAGFDDFYKKYGQKHKYLLQKIKCFEVYPPVSGKALLGSESEYGHAKAYSESMTSNGNSESLGTMSSCEWEVATIYLVFAFKKCKNTWDANGKPLYITSDKETSTSGK
ncbi:mRNA cap guanine-N7 methyltransferase [Bicyclus anynana]|uniref:mRNA cap guanine-N(7) methyltransferase n=1 Tax=Bicyclus anynana TaxID=110368 RepID=A0A6J1NXR0_BICAN|nr:mRNA cap guanine-N7 methyltransferase [Bicyclus anynana]